MGRDALPRQDSGGTRRLVGYSRTCGGGDAALRLGACRIRRTRRHRLAREARDTADNGELIVATCSACGTAQAEHALFCLSRGVSVAAVSDGARVSSKTPTPSRAPTNWSATGCRRNEAKVSSTNVILNGRATRDSNGLRPLI